LVCAFFDSREFVNILIKIRLSERSGTLKTTTSLLILLGMALVGGCSSFPETTRTGEVKDINIEANVSPEVARARPGDEIRWINHRRGTVKLILLDTKKENLSCNRGFATDGTTLLNANQTASICFNKAGEVKYQVRMESALPGGEVNLQGKIVVE
jgi:plastocyanin